MIGKCQMFLLEDIAGDSHAQPISRSPVDFSENVNFHERNGTHNYAHLYL